jgi:hypothetical protein
MHTHARTCAQRPTHTRGDIICLNYVLCLLSPTFIVQKLILLYMKYNMIDFVCIVIFIN